MNFFLKLVHPLVAQMLIGSPYEVFKGNPSAKLQHVVNFQPEEPGTFSF